MTCPHGEVHPEACIDCIEAPRPLKARPRTSARRIGASGDGTTRMTARYDGLCPECGHYLKAGEDDIILVQGEWVCVECGG